MDSDKITRVILIHSKSIHILEAKLRVYKEYGSYSKWRNIILHHAFEEMEDVCLSSGRQKLECLQEAVIALKNSLCETCLETILENSADETFSKSSIELFCQEVNLYYQGKHLGNVHSSEFKCRLTFTVNEIKSDLVKKTLGEVARSFGSRISAHLSKQIGSGIIDKLEKEFGNLYHHRFDGLYGSLLVFFWAFDRLLLPSMTFVATLIWSVDVNSPEWRKKVALEIHEMLCKERHLICAAIFPELMRICSPAKINIEKVLKEIDYCIRMIVRPHQTECMYTFRFIRSMITNHGIFCSKKARYSFLLFFSYIIQLIC